MTTQATTNHQPDEHTMRVNYINAEFNALQLTYASTYKPTLKIRDDVGNSTKNISVTFDQLQLIHHILITPDDLLSATFQHNPQHDQTEPDPDTISLRWHVDDVYALADDTGRPHPTLEQAREVLRLADKYHDASIGINWDVLSYYLDTVLDLPTDDDDVFINHAHEDNA